MSKSLLRRFKEFQFEYGFTRLFRSLFKKLILLLIPFQLFMIFGTPFYFQNFNYNIDLKNKKFAELVTDPAFIKDRLKRNTEKLYVGKMSKAEFSICYIHGFSASRREIEPVVSNVGRLLGGANIFFTRLKGHGYENPDIFKTVKAQDWIQDAIECVEVAARTGEKVILMGTSIGGSLAALVARNTNYKIHSLILISPNFGLKDERAFLLAGTYGGYIADYIFKGVRSFKAKNEEHKNAWTTSYPSSILKEVMRITIAANQIDASKIFVPTFLAFSKTDEILDLNAMDQKYLQITVNKRMDADSNYTEHVIAGDIMNPKGTPQLQKNIYSFIKANY